MTADRRSERYDDLLAAAAFAAVLGVPGVTVYFANRAEFPFTPMELSAVIVPVAAAAWLAVAAGLRLLSLRSERAVRNARYAVLLAAAYLYCNWAFVRHLFPPEMENGTALLRVLVDLALAAVFVAGWFLRRRIGGENFRRLALLLVFSSLVPAAVTAAAGGSIRYGHCEYLISERTKFEFGRRRNVILIVMDAMGEGLFKRTLERFPEVRDEFRDFTAFDRMESHPFAETAFALPAILYGKDYTGEHDDNVAFREYLREAFRSRDSLFANFRRAGFRCEAYPYTNDVIEFDPGVIDNLAARERDFKIGDTFFGVWAASLMPNSLRQFCGGRRFSLEERFVPPPVLFEGARLSFDDAEANHDLICARTLAEQGVRAGGVDDCFKYLHFKGGHHPVVTDEHLRRTFDTDEVRQLRGSLGMVFEIMAELRRLGLYRDALIVVTGDHSERHTRETISLIKLPGAEGGELRFHSTPCTLRDLAGTILAGSGLRPASESLFARAAPAPAAVPRGAGAPRLCTVGNWRRNPTPELPSAPDRIALGDLRISGSLLLMRPEGIRKATKYFEYRLIDWSGDRGEYLAEPLETAAVPPFDAVCFDFRGVPAGEYRLIERRRQGGFATEAILPGFLCLDGAGRAVHRNHVPEPHPRPLAVGETVKPSGFRHYPQLEAVGGCNLEDIFFRLPEDGALLIRLPAAAVPLRLRIGCSALADFESEAVFCDGPRRLSVVVFPVRDISEHTVEVAVPPEAAARGVFSLAVRWRSRDGRKIVSPVLKIRSLTLSAVGNPAGSAAK